ncbi:hypothetical protein N6H14_04750 [Paenibacillus sp. CC-CFT747]|nr:hypothetical protein N6H14_04750 [Paenibacillus sp. CC-CFT747]
MMTESNLLPSSDFNEKQRLIAVTDQASKRILLLDSEISDWNDARAIKWSWHPNSATDSQAWGLPSDVKLRYSPHSGDLCMLVTDSYGLAAIVSYPEGERPDGLAMLAAIRMQLNYCRMGILPSLLVTAAG